MPNLYKISVQKETSKNLSSGELISLAYHDLFDFPLTISEMIKWKAADNMISPKDFSVVRRDGYFFREEKYGIIYKRLLRTRVSKKKLEIAKKASILLSLIPSVKMVAVTGSLAMENADDESDIDLMLITKRDQLWTTRLLAYLIINFAGFKLRKPRDTMQKDKLCLNIWLDESSLAWGKGRNIYTAHEIAQIIPLVNRDETYEKFLFANRWIQNFWPNSVKIQKASDPAKARTGFLPAVLEKLAYKLQYLHMKSKITRETVSSNRALFHPQDWSRIILSRFSS